MAKRKSLKRHELQIGIEIKYFDFSNKLSSYIHWQDSILCRCKHGSSEWIPEKQNIKSFCEYYLNDKTTGFSSNKSGKPSGRFIVSEKEYSLLLSICESVEYKPKGRFNFNELLKHL